MTDFALLSSALGAMDIHVKFWDVYEEYGAERWAEESEDLSYQHHVGAGAMGVSHTVQQLFVPESNDLMEWTIALFLEPDHARVTCSSRYMYQDWPHCLSFPDFHEARVSDFSQLPSVLEEASAILIHDLFTLRRERKCRVLWQAAQRKATPEENHP